MKRKLLLALVAGVASLSITMPAEVAAADRGKAKQSISRPSGAKAKSTDRRPVRQTNTASRSGNNVNSNRNVNRGNNRVVAGNTVVVNGNTDRGYDHYDHHDHYDHWDDDDDDFLEFVGKTAAVTAGVSITAAVIGSIVNDEPDDCQQSMQNGQTYLYCNGVWYQPVMSGSNTQYVVVEDPK